MKRSLPFKSLLLCIGLLAISQQLWARDYLTMAVFQFRPENIESMGFESDVMLAIRNEMENRSEIQLMPKRDMEDVLSRRGINMDNAISTATRAGEILSVRFVLIGSVEKQGSDIDAVIKLVDVDSGQEVSFWPTSYRTRNEIGKQAKGLVDKIVTAALSADQQPENQQLSGFLEPLGTLEAEGRRSVIDLRWSAVPGREAMGYTVYRAENSTGPFSLLDTADGDRYTDSSAEPGVTYYYQLGEIDMEGQENRSRVITQASLHGGSTDTSIGVPIIYNLVPLAGGARMEVLPAMVGSTNDVAMFRVYRKTAGADWRVVGELPVKAVRPGAAQNRQLKYPYIDQLPAGVSGGVQYAVSAVNQSGKESPLSDSFTHQVVAAPELAGNSEELLRRSMLNWRSANLGKGYRIYRRSAESDWVQVAELSGLLTTNWEDSQGLIDGEQYEYRISLFDEHTESGPSPTVIVKTKEPLPPPAQVAATSGLPGRVEIAWQPVSDPDVKSYAIYRAHYSNVSSEGKVSLDWVGEVSGGNSASFVDTGAEGLPVDHGTRYLYAITTRNRFDGEGPISELAEAETKHPPVAATEVAAESVEETVELSWQYQEEDLSGFRIERRWQGEDWQPIGEATAEARSYVDSELRPYDQADYRVVVLDSTLLASAPTEVLEVESPATVALEVGEEPLLRRADLSWNPVSLVDGFEIRRRTLPDGDWETIDQLTLPDATRYSDTRELADGSSYAYQVAPVANGTVLGNSNTREVTTKVVQAPEGIEASRGVAREIQLSWPNPADDDVAGFVVYRGKGELAGDQLEPYQDIEDASAVSFTDTGTSDEPLEHGTEYSYAVASRITLGGLGPLSEVAIGASKPIPEPVYNLVAFGEDGQINISWDYENRDNVSRFEIYRRWQGEDWELLHEADADADSFVDDRLKPYVQVAYKMVVEDIDQLRSTESEGDPTPSPARVELEVAEDQLLREVKLSWNSQHLVDRFLVQRRKFGDSEWTDVKTLGDDDATGFVDKKGLEDGLDYEYRVAAMEGRSVLGHSNNVQAHTKDLPPAPQDVAAFSDEPGQVRLSWQAIGDSDVGGYTIYRVKDGQHEKLASVSGADNSEYVDKGGVFDTLEDGTEYSYVVASYNRYRVEGGRSEVVSAVTPGLAGGGQ